MENLESDQIDSLLSKGSKALIMFYADWCPFCQNFKPIFESLSSGISKGSESKGKYEMYGAKINDDDNPLWDRFSINSVPTVLAFDKSKIVARRDAKMGIGLTKSDLNSILRELKWN
ncbi:MAG TPA: thioredoxin family protein [Nitrososphaeraceae archaeon]|nr:thioredoxin family protein [Nitrososphaeraceae archaeon]